MEKDNKLLTSLLKRLQELDRENKELKEQLSQQNVKATATNNSPV
jgi:DNA-binding protein YbaB